MEIWIGVGSILKIEDSKVGANVSKICQMLNHFQSKVKIQIFNNSSQNIFFLKPQNPKIQK